MAILEDDDQTTGGGNSKSGNKRQELKTIDINDTSLPEGDEVDINPDADAWEQAAPPPDGMYKCKVFLGKQGFQQGELDDDSLTKAQRVFYKCNLVLKIQDNEKWKDVSVFYNVSTYLSAGREISTMLGLIKKTGVNIQPKTTPLAQCKLLRKVLGKEPQLYFKGEWRAYDMSKQENIKAGMKNFPKTEDGKGFFHIVKDSKGNSVSAKWKVDKVFGLKEWREQLERQSKQQQAGGGSKTNTAAVSGGKKDSDKGEEGNFKTVNTVDVGDDELVLDE